MEHDCLRLHAFFVNNEIQNLLDKYLLYKYQLWYYLVKQVAYFETWKLVIANIWDFSWRLPSLIFRRNCTHVYTVGLALTQWEFEVDF